MPLSAAVPPIVSAEYGNTLNGKIGRSNLSVNMRRIKSSPYDKPDQDRYAAQELADIDDGKGLGRLLDDGDLMNRWGVTRQFVKRARLGLHGGKTKLRCVPVGPKTIRYRLRDVLEYEWENMQ